MIRANKALASLLLWAIFLAHSQAQSCGSGCLNCVASKCLVCDNSRLFYLSGNVCVPYIDRNCAEVDSLGKCVRCVEQFVFNTDNFCAPIIEKIPFCILYDGTKSTPTCLRCSQGALLTESDTCFKEIDNCQDYSADFTFCLSCKEGFKLSPFWNNCYSEIPECLNYDETYQNCISCKADFQLSVDRMRCHRDIPNCKSFDPTGTVCSVCQDGYANTPGQNLCYEKIQFCKQYDATYQKCMNCESGHTVNIKLDNCIVTIDNCVNYSVNGDKCLSCSGELIPSTDGSFCMAPIQNCAQMSDKGLYFCEVCQTGFFASEDRKVCYEEIVNCQIYAADFNTCKTCNANFSLDSAKTACNPDFETCSEFSNKIPITCNKCMDGYSLDLVGNCVLTFVNCAQMKSSTECNQCESGFDALVSNGPCIELVPFCVAYSSISGECLQCRIGYSFVNDSCQLTPINCISPYVKYQGVCVKEIAHCVDYTSSLTKCRQCAEDFQLSENNDLCYAPISECVVYSDDKTICLECQNSMLFSLEKKECSDQIANCLMHDLPTATCDTCNPGYLPTINGDKCHHEIFYCEIYNESFEACTKCRAGFTLVNSNSQCVSFVNNCVRYSINGSTCEKCADGFQPRYQR